MLRSQFKDNADADDDILEVGVVEGLAIPFMPLILAYPEFACQFGGAILPSTADTHAFVQLHAYVRERALPNVSFFEFLLYSSSQCLCGYFEEVFHSFLWVGRVDLGVSPDLVQGILNIVNKSADLTKIKRI